MKRLLVLPILLLAVAVWRFSRGPHFDVVVDAPSVPLDTINTALPHLAEALRQHPEASTFQIRYGILPDPARPNEQLPRRLEYNRTTRRLDWHRDNVWFDRYDEATPEIIAKVAGEKGGVNKLLRAGCKRSLPAEP